MAANISLLASQQKQSKIDHLWSSEICHHVVLKAKMLWATIQVMMQLIPLTSTQPKPLILQSCFPVSMQFGMIWLDTNTCSLYCIFAKMDNLSGFPSFFSSLIITRDCFEAWFKKRVGIELFFCCFYCHLLPVTSYSFR